MVVAALVLPIESAASSWEESRATGVSREKLRLPVELLEGLLRWLGVRLAGLSGLVLRLVNLVGLMQRLICLTGLDTRLCSAVCGRSSASLDWACVCVSWAPNEGRFDDSIDDGEGVEKRLLVLAALRRAFTIFV